MTASTEVSWEIDNVPLQTYCSNVETVAGKYGIGGLRGSNLPVAYRSGHTWKRKYAEPRTIPLMMWVADWDPNTGDVSAIGRERQFHKNMTAIQNLTWTGGRREIALTKKWKDPATGNVVSATAKAEAQPWSPSLNGKGLAQFGVDFLLSDPFFYGEEETFVLQKDTPLNVSVKGDEPTSRIVITQNGSSQNATITNTTPTPDHWVRFGTSVASGDSIIVDVEGFSVSRDSDGANLVGSVTRSGSRNWMTLYPGTNRLELTSTSGSGTTSFSYRPAYL